MKIDADSTNSTAFALLDRLVEGGEPVDEVRLRSEHLLAGEVRPPATSSKTVSLTRGTGSTLRRGQLFQRRLVAAAVQH